MKRDFGFTVIELLVVVAMVAILSSIAMPSYLNWRSTAKLNDAVSLICGDLERAKTHAIRRNEFVAILFNADGYTIFVDDGSGGAVAENWSHETGEEFLTSRKLPAGVQIDLTKSGEVVIKDTEYKDIDSSHKLYKYLDEAKEKGIFVEAEYFNPEESITRGQFAAIIVRAFGIPIDKSGPVFADVPVDHTFFGEIMTLKNLGVVNGKDIWSFSSGKGI